MGSVIALTSVAVLWLCGHQLVKQRFARLRTTLPDAYKSAFTASPSVDQSQQLMALCVDLMRKQHVAVPFDELTSREQKMVLHARAVAELPGWMTRYAALWLAPQNRQLVLKLIAIKTSRPERQKRHFGAIKRQQQLRSAAKG